MELLQLPLDSPLFVSAFLGLCGVWARALYGTLEIPLWWPFWSLLRFTLVVALVESLGLIPL